MIESLSDIDWNSLTDFYGRSGDELPPLIETLYSRSQIDQLNALENTFDRICHQASSNELTVAVVPFLLPLLKNPSFEHSSKLLAYLRCIAIGLDSDELHDLNKMPDQISEIRERAPNSRHAAIGLQCYELVENAVPLMLDFANSESLAERMESAYTFAWFPSHSNMTLPIIQNRLETTSDEIELSNLILSIGLLEFQSSTPAINSHRSKRLLDSRTKTIRYASAIYLDWHSPDEQSLAVMRELRDDDELETYPIPFNNYSFWFQYAESRLENHNRA